jgi:hypothetical protein
LTCIGVAGEYLAIHKTPKKFQQQNRGARAKDISEQKSYWFNRVDFNILAMLAAIPWAGRYDSH